MKFKNWVFAFVASLPLTLALGLANIASADMTDCATNGQGVNNHVDGQVSCLSIDSNVNDDGANSIVNDADENGTADDPLFGGTEAWTSLPEYTGAGSADWCITPGANTCATNQGNGLIVGGFAIAAAVFDMYDEVMLFFKDGQFGASAVLIDPTGYSDVDGYWTSFFGAGGLVSAGCSASFITSSPCYFGDFANVIPPGSGTQGAISHINLWVRGAVDVAEPGTLALLGIGLLGFGLRRRKAKV